MTRIATVLGTRPEAVKLAPLIRALDGQKSGFDVVTVATGQQRNGFAETLTSLDLEIDRWLDVLTPGQPLWKLSARLLDALGEVFDEIKPDLVLVQGDTQSALAGAMAGAFRQTPVAHVEAGLRSGNIHAPFPEELNRRSIAQVTTLHFAPTRVAAENLIKEGINRNSIAVTGNTVVDSLKRFCPIGAGSTAARENRMRIIVTSHRRESWNDGLDNICRAIRELASRCQGPDILYILPSSPDLRSRISAALGDISAVRLSEPLPYARFLATLAKADIVLTDSGGVQEETATLGVPTVVMRNETDRPESLALAHTRLSGTAPEAIVRATMALITERRDIMRDKEPSPFGDGRASERIVKALDNWRKGLLPLISPNEEFPG
jgi:UDP-N-acetylglucosamine 2-epimerase